MVVGNEGAKDAVHALREVFAPEMNYLTNGPVPEPPTPPELPWKTDKFKAELQRDIAIETVIEWINEPDLGYTQADMVDLLELSVERCARLTAEESVVDEDSVWKAYDESIAKLDRLVMVPMDWEKHFDPSFWNLPPLPTIKPVPPLGSKDFTAIQNLPKKHNLTTDERKEYGVLTKHKMSATCRKQLGR